jgi:hypothetical protein
MFIVHRGARVWRLPEARSLPTNPATATAIALATVPSRTSIHTEPRGSRPPEAKSLANPATARYTNPFQAAYDAGCEAAKDSWEENFEGAFRTAFDEAYGESADRFEPAFNAAYTATYGAAYDAAYKAVKASLPFF